MPISDIEKLKEEIFQAKSTLPETDTLIGSPVNLNNGFVFDDGLFLSISILIFSLLVFGMMAYLIKIGKEPDLILKTFGSVLIVVSAVFLIVAGYSEQQISPVIGLLGTVAGYILGRSTKNEK